MAKVIFWREKKLIGSTRPFKIYADRKEVGRVVNGGSLTVTLPEGKCTITAKQDFMSASDSLDIDVDDLRPTNINVVYSNPTNVFLARMALILGALGIASLFRILFGWSQYGFLGLAYVLMIAGMLAIKKLQFNHISLSIDEDLHP